MLRYFYFVLSPSLDTKANATWPDTIHDLTLKLKPKQMCLVLEAAVFADRFYLTCWKISEWPTPTFLNQGSMDPRVHLTVANGSLRKEQFQPLRKVSTKINEHFSYLLEEELFLISTSVRSILPFDHYTNVQWAADIVMLSKGSISLEQYFKGSNGLERLRKADLDNHSLFLIGKGSSDPLVHRFNSLDKLYKWQW